MNKLFLIASILIIGLSSCGSRSTTGSGKVISKTYAETDFKDIEVSSSMKVFLTQGNEYSVTIDAEDNILDIIRVKREGEKLIIDFKSLINIHFTKDIIIHITAPDFRSLEASGACSYQSQGLLTGKEIMLDFSGASKANLDLAVGTIKIDATGSCDLVLAGTAQQLAVEGSGSTTLDATNLIAQNASIEMTGAGDAMVHAEQQLDVSISGSGKVKYKGKPNISTDISGSGSVSAF